MHNQLVHKRLSFIVDQINLLILKEAAVCACVCARACVRLRVCDKERNGARERGKRDRREQDARREVRAEGGIDC